MRLNVDISEDMYGSFRDACASRGMSISDRIRELIRKDLKDCGVAVVEYEGAEYAIDIQEYLSMKGKKR